MRLVGEMIEKIRNEKDFKNKWLAERVGVSQSSISRYISGERNIQGKNLEKFSNEFRNLGVDINTIKEFEDAWFKEKNSKI